jgi:hypothetical protein
MNERIKELAVGLTDELLEVVYKYEGALYVSTVIGCLELVKQQLIIENLKD